MRKDKCLGCYEFLGKQSLGNYHVKCSKKLFGTETPPEITFGLDEIEQLAIKSLSKHLAITGVQPKISTRLEKKENDPSHRVMIVDWEGRFILKPPTKLFPQISVLEDLTMHLAKLCGLNVAKHGLVKLKSNELAYVTKRFDRPKNDIKTAVEDFCQLSELLTENKYNSSLEKAGKIILKYATNPGLDLVSFYDLVLFTFITGNSDMHLKNFSLMRNEFNEIALTPFYDLLATKLLLPEDKEEMALTINGKKSKLKKSDFIAFGRNLKIGDKVIEKSFTRILKPIPAMKELIEKSFIRKDLQKEYLNLITSRGKILL